MIILEGEGLANDATALILYRFAVVAVSVGAFSFGHAVSLFAAILVGELVWGMAVGWLMLHLRRWVRDPRIEILLSRADTVPGVLAAGISRWFRCARHGGDGSVHQLERSAAHQR